MDENERESINSLKEDEPKPTTKTISCTQKFFAEFIGTAFLVFVVTGISIFNQNVIIYNGSFEAAFVLTSMIYVFGRISGAHFNPAVTIPMFLRKKITVIECAYYICAQILGAFLGSIFVGLCHRGNFENLAGNEILGEDGWKYISCFFIEILLTFGLVFVIFASTVKKNNFGNLTGLIVGITLYFLGITGSHVSGGSLNPARSIAPAVIMAIKGKTGPIKQLWLYIIAPIIGGVIAGYLSLIFE